MQGHDGLFARWFPIGSSYLMYPTQIGFYQRRFDLFAINRCAEQSLLRCLLVLSRCHRAYCAS
jgi:hypothetical protein